MGNLALETGDQGYGAVIVKDGRIVGQAPSRVVVNRDPTTHAEMVAIRDAARNLGTRDLRDYVMYFTSRACPMCEAATYWANPKSMRFGSSIFNAGEPRLRQCRKWERRAWGGTGGCPSHSNWGAPPRPPEPRQGLIWPPGKKDTEPKEREFFTTDSIVAPIQCIRGRNQTIPGATVQPEFPVIRQGADPAG